MHALPARPPQRPYARAQSPLLRFGLRHSKLAGEVEALLLVFSNSWLPLPAPTNAVHVRCNSSTYQAGLTPNCMHARYLPRCSSPRAA